PATIRDPSDMQNSAGPDLGPVILWSRPPNCRRRAESGREGCARDAASLANEPCWPVAGSFRPSGSSPLVAEATRLAAGAQEPVDTLLAHQAGQATGPA